MFAYELVSGFDDDLQVVKVGVSHTEAKITALQQSSCPWVLVVSGDARGDVEALEQYGPVDDELDGTLTVPVLHLANGEVLGVIRREVVLEILGRGDTVTLDRVESRIGALHPKDGVVAVLEALRDHDCAVVEFVSGTPALPGRIPD